MHILNRYITKLVVALLTYYCS